MDRQAVSREVSTIIRDVLDQPDLQIGDGTSASDVESWDSFNHINVVVAVESHFAIKFATAEIELLKNVGDLVSLVAAKLARREAP